MEDTPGRQEVSASPSRNEVRFTGGAALQVREPRPWKPIAIAAGVVLLILGALLVFGHRGAGSSNPGGAGLAPAAAYAFSLPITQVQMSDSSSLAGGKETYLDGVISNRGRQTVTGVTVQVAFQGFSGELAGKPALPLELIRTREPYIDTEPVSADPLTPGASRAFRLIFDSIPQDWNGSYPAVRVINVETR